MNKYKRLTERHENGYIELMCNSCKYNDKCDVETHYCNEAVKNCLAELEDKIENETLVVVNKPFYSDQFNAWCMYLKEGDYIISARLTKEQADSKLKELQEKQK